MAVTGIFLLTQSTGLLAREPAEQSWDNLKQLKVGDEIQVVQMNFKSLQGTFLGVSEEVISLRVQENEVTLPPVRMFSGGACERNRSVCESQSPELRRGVNLQVCRASIRRGVAVRMSSQLPEPDDAPRGRTNRRIGLRQAWTLTPRLAPCLVAARPR